MAILSLPIHSSAFSLECLANLQNCNVLMVSLYHGLNLSFNVLNITQLFHIFFNLLALAFLTTVILFCLANFNYCCFSVSGPLYDLNIPFTYSLKFFSSLHLSSMSQLNVGCFIMDMPTLGPTLFCSFCASHGHGLDCHSSYFSYCFCNVFVGICLFICLCETFYP